MTTITIAGSACENLHLFRLQAFSIILHENQAAFAVEQKPCETGGQFEYEIL